MNSRLFLRGARALVACLLPFLAAPSEASTIPFDIFHATGPLTLGPGEVNSVPLFITRDTTTCVACPTPAPGGPTDDQCCTGSITVSATGVPPGVIGCISDGGFCLPALPTDQPDLVLIAGSDVVPGDYQVLVRAIAQDGPQPRTQSVGVNLTIVPFSVSVAGQVELLAGAELELPLSVVRDPGFADSVELSFESATAGLSGEIALDPATGDPLSLTLSTAVSLAEGSYPVKVRSVSGAVVRESTIAVVIRSAFKLSISPVALDTVAGRTATMQIFARRDPDFAAPIGFSFSTGHAGITGSLANAGADQKNLVLSVQPSVPPGSYPIHVTASGGGISKSVVGVLKVHRFLLELGDTFALLAPGGGQVSIPITLVRATGFTGAVTFSWVGLPSGTGVGASFLPVSTTGTSSSLRLTAGRFAPEGDYAAMVKATAGSLVESAAVGIEVLPNALP